MSRDPNFVKQASFRALRKIVTEITELFVVVDQSVAASVLTAMRRASRRATAATMASPRLRWNEAVATFRAGKLSRGPMGRLG